MASFSEYEHGYETNWANLQIRPDRVAEAEKHAQRLRQGKPIYETVETRTGVPWWFVGLCHYRESSFNFDTYLGNGQPLGVRTSIVPKGRGPFTGPNAFLDGAVDALRLEGFLGANNWGIARVLYRLEGFNGYGYHRHGVNSPYLYGGSTCYGPPQARAGKFVRDHLFDPNTVDTQLGTAVILKSLMALDASITFSAALPTTLGQPDQPDDELSGNVLWVQQSLNKFGINPQLVEDGKNGPRTMAAVSDFQQQNGLQDTGVADAATIAAIQRVLATPPPAPLNDGLGQRVAQLEKTVGALSVNGGSVQNTASRQVSPETGELPALLKRSLEIAQGTAPETITPAPAVPQLADQLRKATDALNGILAAGNGSLPLGQVNGALGDTLGNLLNGKKTAIGIIGAALTSLLSQVPAGTGLGQVLTMLTPAAGLSPFTMPIFLALTAWGTLGKFEKWSQGSAPPPRPAK